MMASRYEDIDRLTTLGYTFCAVLAVGAAIYLFVPTGLAVVASLQNHRLHDRSCF